MLLRWIARTYEVDADYASAAECAEAAVAAAEAGDDRNALGHALNVLAAVHWRQGNLDDAAKYVQRACYANCDGSTAAPVLNVNDFTCFLNKFAAGDPSANCDRSTVTPVLNVNDFTCFLNKFASGCP